MPINEPKRSQQETLHRYLERTVQKPVRLVLTNNRTRLLSVQHHPQSLQVRIQRVYLDADPVLWREIAHFIQGDKTDLAALRTFFDAHPERPRRRSQGSAERIQPAGKHHDLQTIMNHVNQRYFQGRIDAAITWGPRRRLRPARQRTLGSTNLQTGTIRIHPLLDHSRVPALVVEFIVYHELLHLDLGATIINGRRHFHTEVFRRREQAFEGYTDAQRWLARQGYKVGHRT